MEDNILNRIRLLMEYDTSITLSENKKIITESSVVRSLVSTLTRSKLRSLIKDAVIHLTTKGKNFKGIEGFKGIIYSTPDEIITALKSNSISSKGLRDLAKGIFNSTNDKSLIDKFINEITSNRSNIQKYTNKTLKEIQEDLLNNGWEHSDIIAKKMYSTINPNSIGKSVSAGVKSGWSSESGAMAIAKLVTPSAIKKFLPASFQTLQKGDWSRIMTWVMTGVGDFPSVINIAKKHGWPAAVSNMGVQVFKKWLFLTLSLSIANGLIQLFADAFGDGPVYESDLEAIISRSKDAWVSIGIDWVVPITYIWNKVISPLLIGGAARGISVSSIFAELRKYIDKVKRESDEIIKNSEKSNSVQTDKSKYKEW
jgi:hypothetical protein